MPNQQNYHDNLGRGRPDDYRREEIKALAQAVRRRESWLVSGMPGAGVSNLLGFLVSQKALVEALAGEPVKISFAFVDSQALPDPNNRDAFFDEIARQFSEQWPGIAKKRIRGYERLKHLLSNLGGDDWQRFVVVVDNADLLVEKAGEIFYRNLRALYNFNHRICFIFGVKPLTADEIDPPDPKGSDRVIFAGHTLIVGWFNDRDFDRVVNEEEQSRAITFDAAERKQLSRLTGHHPGLLKEIATMASQERSDLAKANKQLVKKLLEQRKVKDHCQRLWHSLWPRHQIALRALAVGGKADIIAKDTLGWLENYQLLKKQRGARQIFSSVFQQFATDQNTGLERIRIEGRKEEKCKNGQYVISAGKVIQGHREVRVSRLELRLIDCLARAPGVHTKEEILAYVYCGEAEIRYSAKDDRFSRIDNLVGRVRKRLGNDSHIITHWGVGFEFTGYDWPSSPDTYTTTPLK
jgi:DNA-binding winged helix-turn-helix (wHTH) protein